MGNKNASNDYWWSASIGPTSAKCLPNRTFLHNQKSFLSEQLVVESDEEPAEESEASTSSEDEEANFHVIQLQVMSVNSIKPIVGIGFGYCSQSNASWIAIVDGQ